MAEINIVRVIACLAGFPYGLWPPHRVFMLWWWWFLYRAAMMGVAGIVNEFYPCLTLNTMEDNPEASYFPLL